ncbi:MAG: 4Fe-4S dicluster domain-containing protein [Anaerolineae bacterium]|jgi:NAD-dependent dihydropyrimidine dehydrogenase PreA subunit|nr:4Fe-4S dicluster domain-containing protein [Anaerolineae bacterium]
MIQVSRERCTGCGTCVAACPKGAMFVAGGYADVNDALCDSCGLCIQACPEGAISFAAEPAENRAVQPAGEVQMPAKPAPRGIVSALSRSVLPALGTAIAFAGREILPRIVNTWLAGHTGGDAGRTRGAANEGRRLRRRRRGKP